MWTKKRFGKIMVENTSNLAKRHKPTDSRSPVYPNRITQRNPCQDTS